MFRLCLILALTAALRAAAIPAADSRIVNLPDTNTHFAPPHFSTLAEWQRRRDFLRRQIRFAAGLDPSPARTPLHARVFGRIQTRDCIIEKVLIETLPGYYLGGNLYRPLNASGKHPAVLNPHGHWTYGRLENQPLYSGPQFGANLARLGYIVFAYDMVGYNDTNQTPHAFGGDAERKWNFGPFSLQTWNSIRALDFLESLPDVDPSRIGAAGASGGATQTIMLAALDDRIAYAAPVNMVSLFMQGGDYCENTPGLRIGTNNVEIAAMIAPRPLLLVSATGDWTKNTTAEEYPAIRAIYTLYQHPERVETLQLDAPHNFNKANREAVYSFFTGRKQLEKDAEIPKLQDMLALYAQQLPSDAVNYDRIFAWWRTRPAESNEARINRLRLAARTEWPAGVINDATALGRPDAQDRVPFQYKDGQGAPVLVVNGSLNSAPSGRPALSVQLFQTGANTSPRDESAKHFLTFNLSDDQCRIQDILTAARWLSAKHPGVITVVAEGEAAAWVRVAARLIPVPYELRVNGPDRELNIPGIGWASE